MPTPQDLAGVKDLEDDEARLLAALTKRIEDRHDNNAYRNAIYEAKQRVKNLGIALPPQMERIRTVVGWPGTAVDVLEERLELEGFIAANAKVEDLGLTEIWRDNKMSVESSGIHLDALIYGINFVAISDGDDTIPGEPHPLITVEPPTRMTAEYDARTRRLSSAASVVRSEGKVVGATLFLPDVTVLLEKDRDGWVVKDRQEHDLGRVPVVRFVNRPRPARAWGTSEISRAVIAYTDMAVRTLLGMEVAREFYSSPQRYVLGASETAFQNADGSSKTAWETYLGRMLALTPSEDDGKLEVGQFSASSPAPYLEQVRGLAMLLAAEAAMPASYLGFHTDNPASADAIRAGEARLIKRAERRQSGFGGSHVEVADLALQIRDGKRAENLGLAAVWRDAATPTKAAQADAVVKLVAAGVLPADSEVTYDLLGFDPTTKARLTADVQKRDALGGLLAQAAAALEGPPAVT